MMKKHSCCDNLECCPEVGRISPDCRVHLSLGEHETLGLVLGTKEYHKLCNKCAGVIVWGYLPSIS